MAIVGAWRPVAVHAARVWRLPDGAAYYAISLKPYTTSALTPEEVHRQGLEFAQTMHQGALTRLATFGGPPLIATR